MTFCRSLASASLRDDLVDLVADLLVALERDHVVERAALRDLDQAVRIGLGLVRDVLHEQQRQDVVLVLRRRPCRRAARRSSSTASCTGLTSSRPRAAISFLTDTDSRARLAFRKRSVDVAKSPAPRTIDGQPAMPGGSIRSLTTAQPTPNARTCPTSCRTSATDGCNSYAW